MAINCDPVKRYAKIEDPRIDVTIHKDGRTLAVTFSAYNEFDRIGRLSNVALQLSAYTLAKIAQLHDHKGTLGVEWRVLPDGADIAAVHTAWETECECITDHFFNGRPLLHNCCAEPPSAFEGNILRGTAVSNVVEFKLEGA